MKSWRIGGRETGIEARPARRTFAFENRILTDGGSVGDRDSGTTLPDKFV